MMRMRRNFLTSLDKLKVRYNEFMNRVSRWGAVAVAVYLISVVFLFIYATNCTETFCGLLALLAGMPWLLFLDFLGGDSYNTSLFGWVAIALNVLILYFIFATIQRWMKKY